jgi:predicted dehydrogenase
MSALRVGVIGLGIGRHHIHGYQLHPGAEVVAIADPNEDRLSEIGDKYAICSRYDSAEPMLREEELDLVSVCTPNKFHKPLTVAAFKAGCHVLCEKPLAMTAAEGRAMIAAARKAGKRLMVNFSYRFSEQSQALKRQVESGRLGEIYFARTVWHRRRGMPGFGGWFGTKELSGGGPLIDLGVHRIDLALWLMDYPRPVWVLGSAYNPIATAIAESKGHQFDVEDLAVGLVKFENGATLEVEASWAAHIKERELMETRLFGTRGGLVQRNRNETYEFEAEVYFDDREDQYDMQLHGCQPLARGAMGHFVDAILEDRPHTATAEEGLIVQEILDAIYKSAARGNPVQLKKK